METKISIYTAMRMTGRRNDEVRKEADMLVRALGNHGFICLNPAIEENIPYNSDVIEGISQETLQRYWTRDKELIREADVVLDYFTQNASDGANKEIAYARFCQWMPVVRIWNGRGALISRLEDDVVCDSLQSALSTIKDRWGTYEKLEAWRGDMLKRCYPKWCEEQEERLWRYKNAVRI